VGGDYAGAFGAGAPMTPAQRAAFSAWMDRIYNGFVARVAEGRRMTTQQVDAVAKGHVWTGAQARGLGLVDSLGGFPQAVDRAKALAGIKGQARLKSFTAAPNPFAAIARLFGASADSARLMAAASELAHDPEAQALLQNLHDARLRQDGATVLAPTLPVIGR
jgi:protease-4